MNIDNKKSEPPENARGRIVRSYMSMESAYPRYKMSKSQRQLMSAWDKQYPVLLWESKRAERIEKLQGNINTTIKERCN